MRLRHRIWGAAWGQARSPGFLVAITLIRCCRCRSQAWPSPGGAGWAAESHEPGGAGQPGSVGEAPCAGRHAPLQPPSPRDPDVRQTDVIVPIDLAGHGLAHTRLHKDRKHILVFTGTKTGCVRHPSPFRATAVPRPHPPAVSARGTDGPEQRARWELSHHSWV